MFIIYQFDVDGIFHVLCLSLGIIEMFRSCSLLLFLFVVLNKVIGGEK